MKEKNNGSDRKNTVFIVAVIILAALLLAFWKTGFQSGEDEMFAETAVETGEALAGIIDRDAGRNIRSDEE